MISGASQKRIEAAGLFFILAIRIPHAPWEVSRWRNEHPGQDMADGQVTKAEQAVVGRRRLSGPVRGAVRRRPRASTASLSRRPGLKGDVNHLQACPDGTPVTAEFVTSSLR